MRPNAAKSPFGRFSIMYNHKLHIYSVFTALCTLFLIFAGGLVTSTGSGLSVPDWPLSYGKFFPPMIGGIRFEHSHRVIAGSVGLLTLALTIWIFRVDKRRWFKWLGVGASLMVLTQAILGGLTVKFLLPTPISVGHACLGQTFFVLVSLIALFSSKEWMTAPSSPDPKAHKIQRLYATLFFFVYAQLVAGAIVRHTSGKGVIVHIFIALMVFIHTAFIPSRISTTDATREKFLGYTTTLGIFVLAQILLGFAAYSLKYLSPSSMRLNTPEILLATLHQTNGAVILGLSALLTARAFRLISKPA